MNRSLKIAGLLLGVLALFPCSAFSQQVTATVVSVIGGDALKIRDDKGERLVALYGVRIPSLHSSHKQKAKQSS